MGFSLETQDNTGATKLLIADITGTADSIDITETGEYLLSGTVAFNIEATNQPSASFAAATTSSLALKATDTYQFFFKEGAKISVIKTNAGDSAGKFFATKLI